MKFETKFSLGDQVFYMKYNKVCTGHIAEVHISYKEPNWYSESYHMKEDNGLNPPLYSRKDLFKTKEELIETL